MRRPLWIAVITAALIVALAAPAGANGASDSSPGINADVLVWFYGESGPEATGSPASDSGYVTTLGGAISGGYYGNTSNSGADSDAPDSGHGVTASLAPGPAVGGCAGVSEGASLGYAITGNGPAAVGHAYEPDC